MEGKVAEQVQKQMDEKNRELEATSKQTQQAIDDTNEKARKAMGRMQEDADKKIE